MSPMHIFKYFCLVIIVLGLGLSESIITNSTVTIETSEYEKFYAKQTQKDFLSEAEFENLIKKETEYHRSPNQYKSDGVVSGKLLFGLALFLTAFVYSKYVLAVTEMKQVALSCIIFCLAIVSFVSFFEFIIYMLFAFTGILVPLKYNKKINKDT